METARLRLKTYSDRLLDATIAICLVAAIGHLIDWIQVRESRDWKISLGFFAIWAVLIFCSPNWIKALFYCFLAITAFGILGAVTGRTLAGLPLLVPSALIAGAILVWKGERLR